MKFQALLISGGFLEERMRLAQKEIQPFFSQPINWQEPPVDIFLVQPDKTIGINQIRELKKFLSLKPFQSQIKVGLITQAEKLSLPAQHSLLKTLEEPPDHSLLILLVNQSPPHDYLPHQNHSFAG